MDTNKKDQRNHQTDSITNQPSEDNSKNVTPKRPRPRIPVPNTPANPVKPDENPGPPKPDPGINEPEKNDPTRIDDQPPIFNKN